MMRNEVGTTIWLTGLSGSGKSTIANLLLQHFRVDAIPIIFLDGDIMRNILDDNDYSPEGRLRLALTYGRLCKELTSQGLDVVCATISMFNEVHQWNRAEISLYFEVYLKVPMDILIARDPKGIYARNSTMENGQMVGSGLDWDEPAHPDMTFENYGNTTAEAVADQIWDRLNERQIGHK